MIFDRNKPYNDLPLLPPAGGIHDDPDIIKKLVSASKALSSVNNALTTLTGPINAHNEPVSENS